MRSCSYALAWAEPGIVYIFGSPLMDDSQTLKTQKKGKSRNQKYRKGRKRGSIAYRRYLIVSTFFLLPRLGSLNWSSTQASALWTPLAPLIAGICLPACHCQHGTSQPLRSVVEALGTRKITSELSAILTAPFWAVCKDGAALSSEKCSGQGINFFLDQLA